MTDGAVFQFASRADLRKVVNREPAAEDDRTIRGFYKSNLTGWKWVELRIDHLRRHSIIYVIAAEDLDPGPDDLPAQAVAEERQRRWEQHQEAAA
jgi:hypothetical protein